ncbi:MAG TPA: cytochrome c maturation protein CcmE, partial [Steroidobacter sp.]|nr:cytochrome c maturation protein CcmE [Steroidobacter sp.]
MTPRRRRMVLVALIVLGVAGAVSFALTAFQENLLYYYSPTDVSAGKAPTDRVFRVGGMVPEGSFKRAPGSLEAQFVVTDY